MVHKLNYKSSWPCTFKCPQVVTIIIKQTVVSSSVRFLNADSGHWHVGHSSTVVDCMYKTAYSRGPGDVPDCISGLCFCNQTLLHLLLVCVCSNAAFGLSFYKWKVISNSVCHKWSGVELHFPLKCSRMQIYQVQFVKLINVTFHYCKLCSHIFGSIKETSEHHLWIYCFSHLL